MLNSQHGGKFKLCYTNFKRDVINFPGSCSIWERNTPTYSAIIITTFRLPLLYFQEIHINQSVLGLELIYDGHYKDLTTFKDF